MRCRSRTFTGTAIAVAAAAAALALSGCSSDSGSQGKKAPSASASSSADQPATGATTSGAAPATAPSPTTGGGDADSVDGVWLATQGGTKVQLVLGKGKAGLTSTSLCGGSYSGKSTIALNLTCVDGNKERTSGQGTLASDGTTLTVKWSGGLTDTFSRTGLPSN